MGFNITFLPEDQWKNHVLPIGYTTKKYYDLSIDRNTNGFQISLEKKEFDEAVTHSPEEYDFPDRLYLDHWENATAWGIIQDEKLIAAVETVAEDWSKRLRITELWVDQKYQKKGLGHGLMEKVKEQVAQENHRAIILETQSCNVNAVDFYLHEGFTLIGFDTCCYHNNDIERKEVRLEMGWFPSIEK